MQIVIDFYFKKNKIKRTSNKKINVFKFLYPPI